MTDIVCHELTKEYRHKTALNGTDLHLQSGHITGLLGKNGQGKSTLIKILAGVVKPTSGTILIDGQTPGTATKAKVAWLPEISGLDRSLTVAQTLDFWQDFFPDFDRQRAEKLLKQLDLDPGQKLKHMSKGMQEKVQLILVLARDADVYLLDEPMAGVDPVTRDEILDTILGNCHPGSTMLISTHLIADIERILDDVVFLDQGQVVLQGEADALRQQENASIAEIFKRRLA